MFQLLDLYSSKNSWSHSTFLPLWSSWCWVTPQGMKRKPNPCRGTCPQTQGLKAHGTRFVHAVHGAVHVTTWNRTIFHGPHAFPVLFFMWRTVDRRCEWVPARVWGAGTGPVYMPTHAARFTVIHAWSMQGLDQFGIIFSRFEYFMHFLITTRKIMFSNRFFGC